jgi:hypothetical protein
MTKDEIQIELKRRFDERVYKYMDNTDYLTALAEVIIEFTAEQLAVRAENK